MNKKSILFIAAGLLLLAGCVKEPDRAEAGSITINASVGQMTKVSYDGVETGFTAGDRIAVYGWTGSATAVPATRVVNGVVNTLGTDGNWTPEKLMRWVPGGEAHYFLGVYPARAITDFTADAYTLNPAKYTESDLLIAKNLSGVTSKDGPVDLAFGHAMAKLVVNLKFGNDWKATPEVSTVKVVAKTGADINYLGTPVVAATGDASDVNLAASALAPDGYAYSYSGLQVPQDGVRTITVVIGDNEYVYEAPNDIPLSSGKYTTVGLAVIGHDLVEVGSVTLSDWVDGAGLPGGAAKSDLTEPIVFKDSGLKSYLVADGKMPIVDLNRDKEISKAEAALVTSINTLFDTGSNTGRSYTSFNEFQYFTGITKLSDGNFNHWTNLEEITFPESLTSIESGNGDEAGILTDCPKLTTIQGKFSVDGRAVVYNKTLLAVATGDDTSYSIPDGVTRLGSRSVYGVRELGVPASVTNIVNSALADTSRVDRDTIYIYFKGVTPPQCEDHPLGNDGEIDNCHPVKVLVPAVIVDGSVDVTKTKARIEEFKTAFGRNAARMKFSYYTDWPFDEGIHLTATLARKQAYTCDAIPKDSIPGIWFTNEHIAVLYEAGGVRKRADARITAVKPGGEATIRFTVDENAPEDLACTLVYPLSAAKEDNTGAISYGEMASNPQDGTPDGCFDVHVGSATFHTTNSVQTGKVKISPIYAIFKLSLASAIDADHPLTVKDNAGNVITTVKPKTGIDLAYVAMPVSPSTGKYYKFSASTADNKVISLSDNFVIEKGKAYPGAVDQYNGHKYVDLGLPSGLKWATCNVGATTPEEYGNYFAWGETTPKHNYVWGTYKFNPSGDGKTFTKYTTGKKTVLDAEDDAATANWGASWRMPTDAEWTELLENCTIKYESRSSVDVFRITSKNNSATIFLPAAGLKEGSSTAFDDWRGYYWSSSLRTDSSAKDMEFDDRAIPYMATMISCYRCYGLTVRPVID